MRVRISSTIRLRVLDHYIEVATVLEHAVIGHLELANRETDLLVAVADTGNAVFVPAVRL